MGRKRNGKFNPKRAAKFHRYAHPHRTGPSLSPEPAYHDTTHTPIDTNRVIPLTGAPDPGRAEAEEFLPDGKVETVGGGFVSKPPKGKTNRSVSTLTAHTKQVDRGSKDDRRSGPVTVRQGERGKTATPAECLANAKRGL